LHRFSRLRNREETDYIRFIHLKGVIHYDDACKLLCCERRGRLRRAVADYLPNAWTAESVKRFNSNIITLVSNSFTSELLKATLGVMFSGNWGEDNRIFGDNGSLTALYHVGHDINADSQNFGNKIMTTLGLASVVYSLGMKDAAVLTAKKVTKIDGTAV
jgi:hypothetical protein